MENSLQNYYVLQPFEKNNNFLSHLKSVFSWKSNRSWRSRSTLKKFLVYVMKYIWLDLWKACQSPICTLISRLLKALKSLQAMNKIERDEEPKKDKRVGEKNIPLKFYILYFGGSLLREKHLSRYRFLQHCFHESRHVYLVIINTTAYMKINSLES